jgi:hypothetical protein
LAVSECVLRRTGTREPCGATNPNDTAPARNQALSPSMHGNKIADVCVCLRALILTAAAEATTIMTKTTPKINALLKLTNDRQKDLLRYYFGDGTKGLQTMKKSDLQAKLQAHYAEINEEITSIH